MPQPTKRRKLCKNKHKSRRNIHKRRSVKGGNPNIFKPLRNIDLWQAVSLWVDNKQEAMSKYGAMGTWDTSNITSMANLFNDMESFNEPIGGWDTSKVTNMNGMFQGAMAFNQPIGNWNTSKVTNMGDMFQGAMAFNQPIGNWDTSKVTTMEGTFYRATLFNQPIGGWDTSKVTNMNGMFQGAMAFNQPIGQWDTSSVKNMEGVFYAATSFNQPIGNWNTSKVTNMSDLFTRAESFNQPIGEWDTSSVKNMSQMFLEAMSFNQPIGEWDTSSVKNMSQMFLEARSFNQPIGEWDTSEVTNMVAMFFLARSFNQPIGEWDVTSVVNMEDMFEDATSFNQEVPWYNGNNHDDGPGEDEIRDYGEQAGVAFEVHNKFRNINIPAYLETIQAYISTANITQQTNPFISSAEYDIVETFMQNNYTNYLASAGISNTIPPMHRFNLVMNCFKNSIPSKNVKQIIQNTLVFVWSAFSMDEQQLYAYMYIDGSAGAYSGSSAEQSVSCTQGLFERFVTTVKDVLEINPSGDSPETTEVRKQILAILTNAVPDASEMYKMWRKHIEDTSDPLNATISPYKNDTVSHPDLTSEQQEQIKDSFRNFAKATIERSVKTPARVTEHMTALKDFIDAAPQYIQDGGKKKRRCVVRGRMHTKKRKRKRTKKISTRRK